MEKGLLFKGWFFYVDTVTFFFSKLKYSQICDRIDLSNNNIINNVLKRPHSIFIYIVELLHTRNGIMHMKRNKKSTGQKNSKLSKNGPNVNKNRIHFTTSRVIHNI